MVSILFTSRLKYSVSFRFWRSCRYLSKMASHKIFLKYKMQVRGRYIFLDSLSGSAASCRNTRWTCSSKPLITGGNRPRKPKRSRSLSSKAVPLFHSASWRMSTPNCRVRIGQGYCLMGGMELSDMLLTPIDAMRRRTAPIFCIWLRISSNHRSRKRHKTKEV
jgi:hypothetical protein